MASEAPKYVRKKCEHGRYSFQCRDCGGSAFCIHKKRKNNCSECGGNNICIHDRIKSNCVDCKGGAICPHQKRRSRCVECAGGSICIHLKVRSRCVECGGQDLCIHHIRKEYCAECGGSSICEHGIRRSRCADCGGSELCDEHKRDKHNCVECNGKNVCEHRKLRYQCVECHGRLICSHHVRKSTCIICTPSSACQHCQSVSILHSRWKPYCFRCFCVLHPDAKIPRKFKLKEHYVRDRLKEAFEDTLTMTFDKKIVDGCSRHRPDVFIDFGTHCIIIEVDENRHVSYECEMKRMVALFEDIGFRNAIFLRFNPDAYTENGKVHRTPFEYTPTGILRIHEPEMKRRMAQLILRVQAYKDNAPTEPFIAEYLFYGDEVVAEDLNTPHPLPSSPP